MSYIKEKLKDKTIFIILLSIFGCIFCLAYLSIYGNEPQKYTDIVVEYTSAFLANKSAELHLVYILIFGGIIIYTFHHLFVYCKKSSQTNSVSTVSDQKNHTDNANENLYWAGSFLVMAVVNYLINSGTMSTFVFLLATIGFLCVFAKDKVVSGIILYWLSYYAIVAGYRIYALCGGRDPFNYTLINIGALFITLTVILAIKNEKAVYYSGLILQLLIPGLWLIYFKNLYAQKDGENRILNSYIFSPEKAVYFFVISVMLLCMVEIVMVYRKAKVGQLESMITRGTCASVMAFNQFLGTGAIMSYDMRHPYENVIGFQQIFLLGQKPFEEYVPVSGMYSIVHGAFFQLFGKGLFANYNIATNVFYALVIILVIVLLSYHIDMKYVFLLAICLPVFDYNRVLFIMPAMLLLSLPKLIEKPNTWLKTWMLSSLFMGLYYPLFGVAVCVAYVPMAIMQIVDYKKSGLLKKDIKKIQFYIGWIVCFIPVIAAIPWLIGLAGQILAMADQSIYADGLSRFGQTIPNYILSYALEYHGFRIAFYQLLSFMPPVLLVWACGFLAADCLKKNGKKVYIDKANRKGFAIIVAGVIVAAISFSYTFIRLDISDIFSRSLGVLVSLIVILVVYAQRYLSDERVKIAITLFVLCVPVMAGVYGFKENSAKLEAYYTIPEGYVYTDHWDVPNMGLGLYKEETWNKMYAAKEAVAKVPKDVPMFGFNANYGPTYLYGMKGFSTIEFRTVRGYGAANECVKMIKKHKPVVGTAIEAFNNYYLYHWLMTSGYYSYSQEAGMFVPNDEQAEIEETIYANGNAGNQREVLEIGNHAAALGASMDSLKTVFTDVATYIALETVDEFTGIHFEDELFGDDADFMYIKIADVDTEPQYALYNTAKGYAFETENLSGKSWMKKVYNSGQKVLVGWTVNNQDYYIRCNLNKGELLIPLGAGANWLLYNHDCVWVTYEGEDVKEAPKIEEVKMLKLREVE